MLSFADHRRQSELQVIVARISSCLFWCYVYFQTIVLRYFHSLNCANNVRSPNQNLTSYFHEVIALHSSIHVRSQTCGVLLPSCIVSLSLQRRNQSPVLHIVPHGILTNSRPLFLFRLPQNKSMDALVFCAILRLQKPESRPTRNISKQCPCTHMTDHKP